ncbi:MAG: hypothetical protein ACFFD1_14600, partial [Candidatus Thorarchaeota archaeon]
MSNANPSVVKKGRNKNQEKHIKDIEEPEAPIVIFLHIIKIILVIIFYPLIWLGKEFFRLWKFLSGGKGNKNHPLDFNEIAFVESVPIFFTVLGTMIAIIMGIFAWFSFNETIKNFFDDLKNGLSGITNILTGIWNGLKWIFTTIFNFFVDIFKAGIDFISKLISENFALFVIALAIPIFILVVLYLIISETDFLPRLLRKLGYYGLGIADFPRWFYNRLDLLWLRVSKTIGRRVVGKKSLTENTRGFYQRILWLVIIYALWTFLWGILLIIGKLDTTETFSDLVLKTFGNLILVLFVSGVISGFLLMFTLVFILNRTSSKKYKAVPEEIDLIRHNSLVDYLSQRSKHSIVLNLSDVARIADINKNDFERHWTDEKLKSWKLYPNHVVKKDYFDEKIKKIDDLEDEGLENEDIDKLVKAVDSLFFLKKKFGIVPELNTELEKRKTFLYEDIA